MFQARKLLFYTCASPLHLGAGTAIGAIDNPIQREVHSHFPLIAGSGLKGAVRHQLWESWPSNRDDIDRIFGPETNGSAHAGAIAFSDAVLVAFPVRASARTFMYATSAYALGRLRRLADVANLPVDWSVPGPEPGTAAVSRAADGASLVLEAFEYRAVPDAQVRQVADWLADAAFPDTQSFKYFRDKLREDLVVLPEGDFGHFVRHSTVVEPHVKIDDETGTAADTGLFYTENLPPESILAGLGLASVERTRGRNGEDRWGAEEVLERVLAGDGNGLPGIAGSIVQMGGDATTGRGLVVVQPAGR